ncbi:mitochondrial intermediate peptidase, mitochondrial-like isoform X2 [Tripterygium wilfordii]|uniref:mitochondrial intermediate peptidase, mitochondrial-like isoform X2 n=1 Tax=Tripterygium wilfordii TaxID=458696 RepID=UPI0018F82307|nr:mitochondrial intermediate peptidase, mitochondrial-like isoform X2 [Tripterygium wilfordii]
MIIFTSFASNMSHSSSTMRLNHWEVETLFHEFGHALHSLLSRMDYQHFSGTRVAFDFAETLSNLFEYYAWDYRVLKKFSTHYSTGTTAVLCARDMFTATELQRQPPSPETSSIVAELKSQHTSWKHAQGTHWQIRFSHLINCGAGY